MTARKFVHESDEAFETAGGKSIVHPCAASFGRDETGLTQQSKMMRDCGLRQIEAGFDIAHAERTVGTSQQIDHLEPRGISQCFKDSGTLV